MVLCLQILFLHKLLNIEEGHIEKHTKSVYKGKEIKTDEEKIIMQKATPFFFSKKDYFSCYPSFYFETVQNDFFKIHNTFFLYYRLTISSQN